MNEKIQVLFDALKDEYDLGTIEDFTSYLQDDQKRSLFYEQVIAPNYDVSSIEEFENTYGLGGFDLKKKMVLLKRQIRLPYKKKLFRRSLPRPNLVFHFLLLDLKKLSLKQLQDL